MIRSTLTTAVFISLFAAPGLGQSPPGETGNIPTPRITQADILSGTLTLDDIRLAGMKMFTTPFNRLDGYGDGPPDPLDPTSPGGRPTLQNNGTFLRVNGMDAQTCIECHSVVSNAVVPFRAGIGGVGGSNSNAMFMPRNIDVDDEAGNGFAAYDGRFINPPFLFGSGGVQLVAKEMTEDLQRLKLVAKSNPGVPIALTTHGVNFGSIVFDPVQNDWDTSNVHGIDEDLVVRPFGRKGEFATVRGFDVGAMLFHFGMQPVEFVGPNVDGDGDGVSDEILIGELSALEIFNTNLERPIIGEVTQEARDGLDVFRAIGCDVCHVEEIHTRGTELTYSFPEVDTLPFANVFYKSDLVNGPAGFARTAAGGVRVPLFSDLKRHHMGAALAETFGSPLDDQFITARLWGVADTAPYLHDGRATILTDAILLHGGEAKPQSDAFAALPAADKVKLLTFLRALRVPENPAGDLIE